MVPPPHAVDGTQPTPSATWASSALNLESQSILAACPSRGRNGTIIPVTIVHASHPRSRECQRRDSARSAGSSTSRTSREFKLHGFRNWNIPGDGNRRRCTETHRRGRYLGTGRRETPTACNLVTSRKCEKQDPQRLLLLKVSVSQGRASPAKLLIRVFPRLYRRISAPRAARPRAMDTETPRWQQAFSTATVYTNSTCSDLHLPYAGTPMSPIWCGPLSVFGRLLLHPYPFRSSVTFTPSRLRF